VECRARLLGRSASENPSLFPLLIAVTVVGFVLQGQLGPLQRIVDSALTQFPVIGDETGATVRQSRLWPRTLVPHPLGGTDKQVLEDLAKQLDDRSPGLAEHALPACPYRSDEGPGPACGQEPDLPRNAFYCPVGDFIAWDSPA
jgi:hypothetical protein